jgi:hypothetical protein
MKLMLLAAAAVALVPSAASAREWVVIGNDEHGWRWQMDRQADRLEGDHVYVWVRSDLPPGATKVYSPSNWYFKIDCRHGTIRALRMIVYDKASGRQLEERSNPDDVGGADMAEPKSGSIHETIVGHRCYNPDF